MGKTSKEDNSEGLEIVSIGKLYTGPWHKKYWSSSRGKDRYPYPVGYKSLRSQNGVTYTMEIVEGLKGPSFTISSTDGNSCSGGTPDIVWESFQKKGCAKLWHAKRFSCKIDGIEFFGFRNTFVQRLLRELVANVGGATEQSSLPSNFSGKRARNDKVVSRKRLNGNHFKQHEQEESTKNVTSSTSKQSDLSNGRSSDLPTFAAANDVSREYYNPGPDNLVSVIEKEKCLTTAEKGLQLDSLEISDNLKVGEALSKEELISDNLKVGEALSKEEQNIPVPLNHFGLESLDIDNLQQSQEPGDKSKYYGLQESCNILLGERDGATTVQHDSPVFSDAGLFAADTYDHAEESSYVSSLKNDEQLDWVVKDATDNDVAKSEVQASDSLPDDEIGTSAYNTNPETCDSDSVDQDITKSMMSILLPQAVPLLKTFSRRKRKSANPSKPLTQRSHEEKNLTSINMNDSTIGLAEHSVLRRNNEKACVPCSGHDTAVSMSGNSDYVVPDSFDNDGPQDLHPLGDAAQAGQLSCNPYLQAQLLINVDAEANPLPCHSKSSKHDAITAGVTLMAATDALASVTEFTANSEGDRLDCHPVHSHSSIMSRTTASESIICRSSSNICAPEIPSTGCCSLTQNIKINDDSRSNVQPKAKLSRNLQDLLELFACYAHPAPISMVQLTVTQNEIFMSVKCGYSDLEEDTLFVYKALKKGEKMGCPSLIGHAPLQISKNSHGRDIASERSLLQLTPDGQSLVLLNNIKLPYCREGKLHCSCPACSSGSFECDAVKIVRLNKGYASLVTRLKTTQAVCCLLVCETNFLLAAEEGGKLKLWIMNSGWSDPKEDLYLPTFDCTFPSIVELKTIPRSAVLVVGHNGLGEFGIWDIDKRSLVSRFSAQDISVLECIPVTVFSWQRKGEYKAKSLVGEIVDATKMGFSGTSENRVFSPEDNDVAVWLLISTNSGPDSECYQSSEQEANVGGCWRLALLVNNTVITGSVVDGGTAAAAAFGGHGIIGRCDGQVYVWELSTGMKLGNLHSFNGSRVSCITTDASNSGALAIASQGQLLVYLPA
ncbi:hypothetical protein ACS0TY_009737 [Phlomoides rotata]